MAEKDLEKLKKKRASIRSIHTKLINKIDSYLEETDIDVVNCETFLKQLNSNDELLNQLDNRIFEGLSVDDIEADINSSEEYKEKSIFRKVKLERKIKELNTNPPLHSLNAISDSVDVVQSAPKSSVETKSVKLPKLTATKFYGDPSTYLEFWNQYENSIHNNQSLSTIDKFCYLKSLLGGIAADSIKGFTMTPENYDEAIDLLTKTFGGKDTLVNAHMSNLLDIKPLKHSGNLEGLRNLYYSCQTQIRSLNSLGIKSESYSNLLCPILLKLIPPDLISEFTKTQNESLSYDLDELMQFLYRELRTLERTNAINSTASRAAQETNKPVKGTRGEFRFAKQPARVLSNRKPSTSINEFVATVQSQSKSCIFCEASSHDSSDCEVRKIEDKKEKLKRDKRCFLCLKVSSNPLKHRIANCSSQIRCTYCGLLHNRALCYKRERDAILNEKEKKQIETETSKVPSAKEVAPANVTSNYVGNERKDILLQTIKAEVVGDGQNKLIFCLFDNGSSRSFVRTDISRGLKLKVLGKEQLLIHTFHSKIPERQVCRKVLVNLKGVNDRKISFEALEIDEISNAVLTLPDENITSQLHFKGIVLTHSVDDLSDRNQISLLIGADNYWDLMTGKIERLDSHLVALETSLGWSIQGKVEGTNEAVSMNFALNERDISYELKQFWEIENLGVESTDVVCLGNEDNEILNSFKESVCFVNGRYRVKMPWKAEMKDALADNKEIAFERLVKLTRQFRNNPEFFGRYSKVLDDYAEEGIIVHSSVDKDKQTFYLPHRAVVREDKSTSKLRIVFDASSHAKGQLSLNDCLHTGPNLNPNLLELLLKFRENAVAITSDIKQAFLQIELDLEDRDFTRFYWTNELSQNELIEPKTFKFCRVLFGLRPSPYLLAATLKYHFEKYKDKYPDTYEILNNFVYVDDVIAGSDDVNKALDISVESINILKDAGMLLRKWQTNSKELINLWKNLGIEIEESHGIIVTNSTPSKVLGVAWKPESDEIYFDVSKLVDFLSSRVNTKRFVLQVVGRIFDPIGFLSPFVIRIKCFLQEIWRLGTNWDEELPNDLLSEWQKWCNEVEDLSKIRIPRYYLVTINQAEVMKFEIHCFSDANISAYGSVLYLRIVTGNENIYVSFISSKTRVAPLKTLSLPRLELMGALMSARLAKQVAGCLKLKAELFYWTDSTITYFWIRSEPEKLKPFVKNRVKEIQSISQPYRWFHCPGRTNPADLLTRGMSALDLGENSFWWHGPPWLREPSENWPVIQEDLPLDCDLELRKTLVTQQYSCMTSNVDQVINIDHYSSLLKLLRITAYVKRFILKASKRTSRTGPLTATELNDAKEDWIRFIQRQSYNSEIECLEKKLELSKNSPIYSFAPFLDDSKILRIGGRLKESEFTHEEKHPAIMPRDSAFTELIIKQAHLKIFHGGVAATLARIRTQYWIPKGRQMIKKVINKCLICRKYTAQPASQITSQLPKDRISETPPFTVCGIDFAGPISIKTSTDTEKAYVALFTCAVTRAIHLELVSNLSTEKFLFAMRRFISRRGNNCSVIYSDNAKTFKCANKEFIYFANILKHQEVQDFVTNKGITWKYIIERAAWWGGFYERLVKSIKECLRKILGKSLLTFEELTTILSEVEAVLNLRPISYVYSEYNEPEPLTPAHFLSYGKSDFKFPLHFAELFYDSSNKSSLLRRRAFQLNLLKQIWKKWKAQYLLDLRTAHRMTTANHSPELKVGDVVLLEGSQKCKLLWEIGVIEEVYRGRDNEVRSCLVRLSRGTLKRPIQLLYPLELN